MMDVSNLEEIAEQTTAHTSGFHYRGKFGFKMQPNIARASAAREKSQPASAVPDPVSMPDPAPMPYVFTSVEITSYSEALKPICDRIGDVLARSTMRISTICAGFP